MKAKILVIFVMFLLLASTVSAFSVFVLSINYDKGEFSLNDKTVKLGFSPDRKIQPEDGYILEIISDENEVLYSFKFDVPLKIYLDSSDEISKALSGGYIVLDKVDFALVTPYFDNAKEIRIYKPSDIIAKELALIIDVEEIKLSKESKLLIYGFSLIGLLILILLVLLIRKIIKKR